MTRENIDLSSLSAADLQAEIERRAKAEKQARSKARKEFITDKDNFLTFASGKFQQLQNELKELKASTIKDANNLYNRMYEMEGKEPKEVKSFTMKNEADSIKITVDRQERIEFNENATVHIEAIKEIFRDKFENRNKGMYNLLDSLLIKGNKGDYDPRLLAKARRAIKDLGDEKLIDEFRKLEECQRVVGSALYCRCYVRDDQQKWTDVSLQFSAL